MLNRQGWSAIVFETESLELRQREAQMVVIRLLRWDLKRSCRPFEDFLPSELGGHLGSTNQGID